MLLKLSFSLLFIIVFVSCSQSEEDLSRIKQIDSLKTLRLDSIRIEQEKVIGDIRFGMDKKTTEKLWEKFCEEHKRSEDFGTGKHDLYYTYYIGDYQFWQYLNSSTHYYNDSLYYFTIRGRSVDIDFTMDMLSKKFGNPEWVPKESREFTPTFVFWNVGDKKVEIAISDDGYLDIVISKPKMMKKKRIKEKQISSEKSEIAKEVF